ncbi:alpha-(1-2)-phosphatidylinositol mannosyltransferase [Mycobacterium kansasii]|uniref:GDP-mannose-dependent alpha-(1-6)-phosphatidylinositol dimannoside mannosyltransferase n=1 Tax=Mycobacterium attenuatum TaxID=2341086 RepID=A0A498Q107_9MYCO|nr:glycosyltransferase [Mycobacterium attenuatum]ORB87070.1 alpha-(1-2)-phosphatidylinositol mannosyltransferase [Mycobacterium kansasii]VBA38977.1 GDP-mannose-dependent alpha-(1-6)-phosphatidylinositol dimannoside mannosyltransferase [Mycobacterium attenuatum]VBA53211.1 GDP-mannose-dependent alpha-(1-6)-phosphatidylinositol dimannoside mannosyltransferase [Mycobacterium attenuatum]VBA58060.1 GDP-mannose-dependent alpha-(1-6)-phosphatidylinositol dimannoside mannosyltransferase [Mycobacterium a
MRVVQVANFYGPRSGGLRTAVDRLGSEYCAGGHQVFLIVPGAHATHSRLSTGVVRITLPAKLIPFTGGYRAVLPAPVRALLETLRPDALEVSDRLTLRSLGRWGRDRGVTTVMISHERLDRFAGHLLPRRTAEAFADAANRRTAADYDTVVCTTAFARAEFDRIGATNVATVPLGVDLHTFHPRRRSALVRQRFAAPAQLLLVHCGRLSVEKRADRSIGAVAALCDSGVDARLVVVGEGPLRARLQRQAAGLPVTFTGFISDRHTVATLLACADVTLAPGPHETFGLAALESLACGTPVVVSRTSALAEIITTDSGASAGNSPAAIAAAVSSLVDRPEHVRRSCARRRAETFTWQQAAAGMLAALGAGGRSASQVACGQRKTG